MGKIKETDLGPLMIKWLQQEGYEVYQEVRLGERGMPIIDLIGVKGSVLHAVELKTTFGLSVMAQADYNKGFFYYSSVAVLKARRKYGDDKRPRAFAESVCRDRGIGVFYLNVNATVIGDEVFNICDEAVPPRQTSMGTKMSDYLLGLLHPNQRVNSGVSIIAGSKGGGYHTPYKELMEVVKAYINDHPGAEINEIMGHLYEQARLKKISSIPLQPTLMANLRNIENWCICKKRKNHNTYYVR